MGDDMGPVATIRRHVRRRGAAMVELALVLPVLLMLLFGVIEYGWVFLRVTQVNEAARRGVRMAVRPSATDQEVRTTVSGLLDSRGLAGRYDPDDDIVITELLVEVGQPVTVQVTVDYDGLIGFVPTPQRLSGTATMAKEVPSSGYPDA
jgi:Flp pilus assembly protein TadG